MQADAGGAKKLVPKKRLDKGFSEVLPYSISKYSMQGSSNTEIFDVAELEEESRSRNTTANPSANVSREPTSMSRPGSKANKKSKMKK